MDSDTEFPMPNRRERETISHYLRVEENFMAKGNFYSNPNNINIRKLAVWVIATELFVYLEFLLSSSFSDASVCKYTGQGVEVRLVAICCLIIAAKMRASSFSLTSFLEDRNVDFKLEEITRTELRVLNELKWKMRPVTPFYFLDYFYPTFKRIGGFKRHSINEIIVQAQGETNFTDYKPSQIAYSSLLAATQIAYPSRIASIAMPAGLDNCYRELVALCLNKDIKIERAKLETASSSSSAKVEEEEETELPVSTSEIVPVSEAAPKRLMNFGLIWPTDVSSIRSTHTL
ncbi:hypothetical protein RIF29_39248 [Crotalaria pallida]|uniref:B-like cyclin n=1 Tax=Crotalaria pallida TaxID=3830 RepID=A0AAN9HQI2_CROPI